MVNLFKRVGSFLIINMRFEGLAWLAPGCRIGWGISYEVCHVEESLQEKRITSQSCKTLRDHLVRWLRLWWGKSVEPHSLGWLFWHHLGFIGFIKAEPHQHRCTLDYLLDIHLSLVLCLAFFLVLQFFSKQLRLFSDLLVFILLLFVLFLLLVFQDASLNVINLILALFQGIGLGQRVFEFSHRLLADGVRHVTSKFHGSRCPMLLFFISSWECRSAFNGLTVTSTERIIVHGEVICIITLLIIIFDWLWEGMLCAEQVASWVRESFAEDASLKNVGELFIESKLVFK